MAGALAVCVGYWSFFRGPILTRRDTRLPSIRRRYGAGGEEIWVLNNETGGQRHLMVACFSGEDEQRLCGFVALAGVAIAWLQVWYRAPTSATNQL